jgi:LCP family protein required for cell wall assembly
LGLDAREGEENIAPPRTDTIMLLTFDPATNAVKLLSIPRDLWVAIPGYENGKINTAYQLGEAYQVAGSGPGLAMETVELLFGLPVDYYVQIDFSLFERFINEIGGVKLDIPEPVEVVVMDGNPKTIQPGLQTLPGDVTLAYVRARNTSGGDFDRVQRQQLVLLGIRNRILDFQLLPDLIAKAPLLYGEFSDTIRTNLTPNDVFKLAVALQGVPFENISLHAIGLNDVTFGNSPEGTSVLIPLPERFRTIRNDVFVLDDPLSPTQISKTLFQRVDEEFAKIAVINGTVTPGLAAQTTEFLLDEDLNVTRTDIANEIYNETVLIDYTGNPYTVEYLVLLLNIRPTNIIHQYNPRSNIDIQITLGDDWLQSGVLP